MDNRMNQKLDDRYLIEELLGTGGMANVYRGRDLQTGRVVAIKILREEFLSNADLVRRFKNESKAISVLDHPNIVKVYDISISEQLQYIVMEYIDGITLKEYMEYRNQPLTYKETLHFVSQILQALQHAHDKGIVHRDVKPQNVMLLADGTIKVMDFGIARFSRSENQTITDKAIGSVHYISPEQAKGDTTDAKADLYSVGVMMYEMLGGKLPFESDNPVQVAIKQIAETPTPLRQLNPAVPEALEAITNRAMAKEARDRYPSAQAMLADLEEFVRNPSVKFQYQYLEDAEPTRYVDKVVSKTAAKQPLASRGQGAAKKTGARKSTKGGGKKKGGKRSLFLPILAGVSAAFAIGAAILVVLIFKSSGNALFSQHEDVELPNFTNMSLTDIENNPAYSQFRFEIQEAYNTEYPAGVVYDQTPKAPKQVKDNAQVILRVSKGVQVLTLPDLVTYTKSEAQKTLQDMGLSVTIKTQVTTEVSPGIVLSMDPVAGSQVETGQTVILYISREEIVNSDQVPSVIGMDAEAAKMVLQAKKFALGTITEVESDAAAGTIVAQSPEAGTEAYFGDSVYVSVSLGYVNVTRTVTVNFEASNDGGTWAISANGETQTFQAEAGVASQQVFSFTDHGTYEVQLYAPSGQVAQTATLNFGTDGGDITFTIKGNTVPKHDHVWGATDPATGKQTCSVCSQTQQDPNWTSSSSASTAGH